MSEPIYVHEYLLRSGVALNAVSQRRVFAGALICVDGGYGCVHPWPEFGDAGIDEQLELLSCGITTPLTDAALRCAEKDGAARRAGSAGSGASTATVAGADDVKMPYQLEKSFWLIGSKVDCSATSGSCWVGMLCCPATTP